MTRIIVIAGLCLGLAAQAKPVPELTKFTQETVKAISTALAEAAEESEARSLDDWMFKRFFLRITAKAGFDVELIKLELLPELELVWQNEG